MNAADHQAYREKENKRLAPTWRRRRNARRRMNAAVLEASARAAAAEGEQSLAAEYMLRSLRWASKERD